MTSARRLWWLALGFSALAVASLLGTMLAVAPHVSLAVPAVGDLLAACGRLIPSAGPGGLAVLAAIVAAGVVLLRGTRAAANQLRGQRDLRSSIDVLSTERLAGVRHYRIAGEAPQAFCAGLFEPRIYVSEGAIAVLREPELAAVLAHEEHHRRRRDPLRLALGAALADAFFFVPALRHLHRRYAAVAELAADEAAVRRTDESALASAMLRFAPAQSSVAVGIAPERVDHLLGQPPRWEIPTVLLPGSLAALAAFVAVALTGAASAGTVNVPMALMGSCALLMATAAAGAIAGALSVVLSRRR